MAGQENGGIKNMKVRMPMELYQQLCKDAKAKKQAPRQFKPQGATK